MNHDEAMFALNDHVGCEVELSVGMDIGDYTATAVYVNGRLGHHKQPHAHPPDIQDELAGLYRVGEGEDAYFDVTDLHAARQLVFEDEPYGLAFDLGDNVTLAVTWGTTARQ